MQIHFYSRVNTPGLPHGHSKLIYYSFPFQAGQGEPETNVSTYQVGNSQSSESKNVLQRSSGSPAILGEMVSQEMWKITIYKVQHCKLKSQLYTSCNSCISSGLMFTVHAEQTRLFCGYGVKKKSKLSTLSQHHHSRYCTSN